MNIVITGGNGFIAKNLRLSLLEKCCSLPSLKLITRTTPFEELKSAIENADLIYHFAGEMRSADDSDFIESNVQFTSVICSLVAATGRPIKIVFASSISVVNSPDSIYSKTKLEAEIELKKLSDNFRVPVVVYRLPHVFGKWSKPFYNSIIATVCYSASRELPVSIHNPDSIIYPLYIDNLVDQLCEHINPSGDSLFTYENVMNVHTTSVGEIYDIVQSFSDIQKSMKIESVGVGLIRELYSTYVSFLPKEKFSYSLKSYADPRGSFVEFLKTESAGQISYFTANPGVSRGNHYHHTKTEKFLVVHGKARFAFKSLMDDSDVYIETSSDEPTVVDSIPGWAHNITNIGDNILIVLLWANEVFDKSRPDTIYSPIENSDHEKT